MLLLNFFTRRQCSSKYRILLNHSFLSLIVSRFGFSCNHLNHIPNNLLSLLIHFPLIILCVVLFLVHCYFVIVPSAAVLVSLVRSISLIFLSNSLKIPYRQLFQGCMFNSRLVHEWVGSVWIVKPTYVNCIHPPRLPPPPPTRLSSAPGASQWASEEG